MAPTVDPITRALADATDTMMVHAADRFYLQRDWASALQLYRGVAMRNAQLSAQHALPLAIGHCAIETDDAEAVPAVAPGGGQREALQLHNLRARAYELCRAGDFGRATRLLRFIADACPQVGPVYADGLLGGESAACAAYRAGGDGSEPAFLAALGAIDTAIPSARQRAAGLRLLLVVRRFHYNNPNRQNEFYDYLHRAGVRFGLEVRELNAHWQPVDIPRPLFPARLMAAIDEFEPHVIVYDDLEETGISAETEAIGEEVAFVLERARQRGARVVKCLPDGWMVPQDRAFRGLGTYVDLVHHCHPAMLAGSSERERAATFCYPWPHDIATTLTMPAGSVPRACFVGTIFSVNYPRLAWWAEAAMRALPIDFMAWLPADQAAEDPMLAGQFGDADYLSRLQGYRAAMNLTRRSSGVKILTQRTLDIPALGGLLLEEHSFDATYFLKPGVHYLPFETLGDLGAAIDVMLSDDAKRQRMIDAGKAWVTRYFTGDHFWTGLLSRLYG